jgi:hypothetical protein
VKNGPPRHSRVRDREHRLRVAVEIRGGDRASFEDQRFVAVVPPAVGHVRRKDRRLSSSDGDRSLRTWEDLVRERGWTAKQYEKRLGDVLLTVLTNRGATRARATRVRRGRVDNRPPRQ